MSTLRRYCYGPFHKSGTVTTFVTGLRRQNFKWIYVTETESQWKLTKIRYPIKKEEEQP